MDDDDIDEDNDEDDDDDDGQRWFLRKIVIWGKNSFIELFHLVIIFDDDVGGKKQWHESIPQRFGVMDGWCRPLGGGWGRTNQGDLPGDRFQVIVPLFTYENGG